MPFNHEDVYNDWIFASISWTPFQAIDIDMIKRGRQNHQHATHPIFVENQIKDG
jgi:hypothetical protein